MLTPDAGILDALTLDEPCIGAVFTSFGFNPPFFEEQLLRSVLRLMSDPQEQPLRFHYEAQRALQAIPVAVFVDAHQRTGGRRLTYDLIEIISRIFHPKAVLLLYAKSAVLQIASANLTSAGYENNAELIFRQELTYSSAEDAAILRDFAKHLERVQAIARQPSSQLSLVLEELRRKLPASSKRPANPSFAFCDSTLEESILQQVAARIPNGATVTRIGMLAPFYERDDASGDLSDALDGSIFGELAKIGNKETCLDVAIFWNNAPVHCDTSENVALEDGLGRLWAWSYTTEEDEQSVMYLVPVKLTASYLYYRDQHGERRKDPLSEALEAHDDKRLWLPPKPEVFAPATTLMRAEEHFADVQIWLHPAARLRKGKPIRRPLHAKLLLITYDLAGKSQTLVMLGSANMSRKALLFGTDSGANVELSALFCLDGERTVSEFCPELVLAPEERPDLLERELVEPGIFWGMLIDRVLYDPKTKALTIAWSQQHESPPDGWQLCYLSNELARGETAPKQNTDVFDFELLPSSAEVTLIVASMAYSIPIIVTDLVALPPGPALADIGLQELLLLLGRRVGLERASMLVEKSLSGNDALDVLGSASEFGMNLSPTDVFRAWWCLAEQLADSGLSVQGVRLQIDGTIGLRALWERLKKEGLDNPSIGSEAVWFYGVELVKELRAIKIDDSPDRNAKLLLIRSFIAETEADLQALSPIHVEQPWIKRLAKFYSEEA